MLLVSSCVPVIAWLCSRMMRFQSRPVNWPWLTIESPVAQWLEHPTRSRRVVGSNPIWGSDFFRVLQTFNLSCVYGIKIIFLLIPLYLVSIKTMNGDVISGLTMYYQRSGLSCLHKHHKWRTYTLQYASESMDLVLWTSYCSVKANSQILHIDYYTQCHWACTGM